MAVATASSTTSVVKVKERPSVASPRKKQVRLLSSVLLVLIGITFLLPLAWIVLASVDTNPTISIKIPTGLTLQHYADIMNWQSTFRPLAISTILALGTAIVTIICALLAAYPLSRYEMRFKKSFMYTVLFGTCLPITAMMVPVYALFVSLHLLNNLVGVIFFMAATGLPMAIWMSKNFMDSIPVSLEEAAWIDGASAMQTLWRIVIPLMKPGIAVVFVFVFTGAWGNFFVPFILLPSLDLQPASIAITGFFGNYGLAAYGKLSAFAILYSLPAVVLYVISQRIAGNSFAMAGGVKG